jgi:hypothetical protein
MLYTELKKKKKKKSICFDIIQIFHAILCMRIELAYRLERFILI